MLSSLQHGMIVGVAELDRLEGHGPPDRCRKPNGCLWLGHRGPFGQDGRDLLERRARRLQRVVEDRDVLHRVVELAQIQQEGRQHAEFEAVVRHAVAADEQHGDSRDVADQRGAGNEHRVQLEGLPVCIAVVVVERREDRVVALLATERLHRSDAVERLDDVDDQGGDRLAGASERDAGACGEPSVEQPQRDQRRQRDERKRQVEDQQQH